MVHVVEDKLGYIRVANAIYIWPIKDWKGHPYLAMTFWYSAVVASIIVILTTYAFLKFLGFFQDTYATMPLSMGLIALILWAFAITSCAISICAYPICVWATGKAELTRRGD